MNDLPVTFTVNEKTYTGYLTPVMGGGSSALWHLMVEGFYQGQLIKTETYGWQFHTQSGEGKELAEYFGRVVEEAKKS